MLQVSESNSELFMHWTLNTAPSEHFEHLNIYEHLNYEHMNTLCIGEIKQRHFYVLPGQNSNFKSGVINHL